MLGAKEIGREGYFKLIVIVGKSRSLHNSVWSYE